MTDTVLRLAEALHRVRLGCEYDADLATVSRSGYWCDDLEPNFHQGSRVHAWQRHYADAEKLQHALDKETN